MCNEKAIRRGEELFAAGDTEKAKQLFELIINEQPQHYEAINNLGVVYHALNDIKMAETCFLKAIEINKEYLEAKENLNQLYQDINPKSEYVYNNEINDEIKKSFIEKPVFLISSERSGTNLLRRRLTEYQDVYFGPSPAHFLKHLYGFETAYGDLKTEENFLSFINSALQLCYVHWSPWETVFNAEELLKEYSSLFEARNSVYLAHFLHTKYATAKGYASYLCKDNLLYNYVEPILKFIPDARFIYLFRDPRDYALSQLKRTLVSMNIFEISELWKREQRLCHEACQPLNQYQWIKISYEDLISDELGTILRLCRFLEVPIRNKKKLIKIDTGSSEDWENLDKKTIITNYNKYKKELSNYQIAAIEHICWNEMKHLGYNTENRFRPKLSHPKEVYTKGESAFKKSRDKIDQEKLALQLQRQQMLNELRQRHISLLKQSEVTSLDTESPFQIFHTSFTEIDITPKISARDPVYLQGFLGSPRIASAVVSPLMLQICLFQDVLLNRSLFLAADVFGFDQSFVSALRHIARPFGIPPENIVVNASHTHYAPGTVSGIAEGLGLYYPSYVNLLLQNIQRAIPQLIEALSPSKVFFGKSHIQIGANRRRKEHGKVAFSPNPHGQYDKNTPFLFIKREKGNPLLIVNHGCHPTGLGGFPGIFADFPGFFREYFKRRGISAIFLQGAAGTVKQIDSNAGDSFVFCESPHGVRKNGENLAKKIEENLNLPLKTVNGTIQGSIRKLNLPLRPINPEVWKMITDGNDCKDMPTKKWAAKMLQFYNAKPIPRFLEIETQLIEIGDDIKFITLPGEPSAELALKIRKIVPKTKNAFILGYTNGLVGYLPSDEMIDEGGYEVDYSHVVYDQPAGFSNGVTEAIVKASHRCIEDNKEKKGIFPFNIFLCGGSRNQRHRLANLIKTTLNPLLGDRILNIDSLSLPPQILDFLGLADDETIADETRIAEFLKAARQFGVWPIVSVKTHSDKPIGLERWFLGNDSRMTIQYRIFLESNPKTHNSPPTVRDIVNKKNAASTPDILDRLLEAIRADSPAMFSKIALPSTILPPSQKKQWGRTEKIPPPIFIIGAPRSGTTLLYQLLVNHFHVGYFSNFIADEFPSSPIIGYVIGSCVNKSQEEPSYKSDYGKAQGEDAPSEYGNFWYRWFPKPPHVYVAENDLDLEQLQDLKKEITALSAVKGEPFIIKNTFNSMRIAPLATIFNEAVFIVCKRDPGFIAQSILRARMDLFKNKSRWWSLMPKEFDQIANKYPWEQVADQVYYIYNQIEKDKAIYGKNRFFECHYESLCENPERTLNDIESFLKKRGIKTSRKNLPVQTSFKASNKVRINETDFKLIENRLIELGMVENTKPFISLDQIDAFISDSPQGTLFCRPWWLEALAPGQWEYLINYKHDGSIDALMPIVWHFQGNSKTIAHPPLTQTLGVLLPRLDGKTTSMLSKEISLTTALIDIIPAFNLFIQNFNFNFHNWLPFYWKGFQQTTRYTYVIDDLHDINAVWSGFKENIRREIRKAEKRLSVVEDLDIDAFADINEMTFKRQGIAMPYTRELLKKLHRACVKHNACKIFFAIDKNNQIHAANYLAFDNKSAYYLMGGADPKLRNSGATSLLMWECIKFSAKVTKRFDFEGSMMPSVERFFRAFGGKQMPYFQIIKKA